MKQRFVMVIAALVLGMTMQAQSLICEIDNEQNPLCIGDRKPLFSWRLKSDGYNIKQKAYRIIVREKNGKTVWDSGRVKSDRAVSIRYAGSQLQSDSDYTWSLQTWYKGEAGVKSCTNGVLPFHTCLFDESDWGDAAWIAMEPDREFEMGPADKYIHSWTPQDQRMLAEGARIGDYALPQFRKCFQIYKTPVSAVLYICGLGQFDVEVNGENPTETFLNPGWTQFDKEVQYLAFDVTESLVSGGENVISVLLGNGFFNIPNVPYYKITGSFGAPRLRSLLKIKYSDGTEESVASGADWRCCPSPMAYSTVYRGESFDASAEQKGWRLPGFDDSAWPYAVLCRDFSPRMICQRNFPLGVRRVLSPVDTTRFGSVFLFDMGQNFSGIFRLRVRGERGDRIRIRPAEFLRNGRACQDGTGAPYIDEYILSGEGDEEWSPKFTYYGQRWFEVEGVCAEGENANMPELLEFEGLHTCAEAPEAGGFECSNKLYNDIYRLSDWAFRSNLASVLTDCPHREKLGWQEQTYLTYPAFACMYRLDRLYLKSMQDLCTAQRPDGCLPTIAPEYVRFEWGFEDTPEWGLALVFNAWNHYLRYGDSEPICRYYPAMKRYMEYLESRAGEDGVIAYGLGDWLDTGGVKTSLGITSHCFYCQALSVLIKMARLQGLVCDVADFKGRFESAAKAFNSRFLNTETGVYDNGTQADYACALGSGVVPDSLESRVYANLLAVIKRDGSITAGEVAHPLMLRIMSDHGDDAIYSAMHQQREKPGYGYMIDRGSTTLTEAWDGTLSQNHFANDAIVEWFFERLAGIRQVEGSVAYRHLEIRPRPVPDVDWVKCHYDSPYGRIVSNWTRRPDGMLSFHVQLPPCTDAVFTFPDGKSRRLGSGSYDFTE